MPTALGQLLCLEHPRYKAALTSLLRFPIWAGEDAAALANGFNIRECRTRTGVPSLGSARAKDDIHCDVDQRQPFKC
jgi:hypothetical protein